jgi:hypothetical protein
VSRIAASATDHPHRAPVEPALDEASVSPGELLVGDLTACISVSASLPGVDDLGAVVLVIRIAARDDDRVGPIFTTGDSALQGPMHADSCELSTVRELTLLGVTGNVPVGTSCCHEESLESPTP